MAPQQRAAANQMSTQLLPADRSTEIETRRCRTYALECPDRYRRRPQALMLVRIRRTRCIHKHVRELRKRQDHDHRALIHAWNSRRCSIHDDDGGDGRTHEARAGAALHRAWQCWCICPVKDRSNIVDTVVALRAANELGSSGFILRPVFGRHK